MMFKDWYLQVNHRGACSSCGLMTRGGRYCICGSYATVALKIDSHALQQGSLTSDGFVSKVNFVYIGPIHNRSYLMTLYM